MSQAGLWPAAEHRPAAERCGKGPLIVLQPAARKAAPFPFHAGSHLDFPGLCISRCKASRRLQSKKYVSALIDFYDHKLDISEIECGPFFKLLKIIPDFPISALSTYLQPV